MASDMSMQTSSRIARFLCLLPALAVALAALYVNLSAVGCFDSVGRKNVRRGPPQDYVMVDTPTNPNLLTQVDLHYGWPTTYCVVAETAYVRYPLGGGAERNTYSIPTYERIFVGPFLIGINLLWALAMALATWAVCTHVVEMVRCAQFSLRIMLIVVTVMALCLFMAVHYRESAATWTDCEVGRPYLPLTALYRWFGPRSPYDWLWHFDLTVRIPLLIGRSSS